MEQIFVFARVGSTKYYIGMFNDISALQYDVSEHLANINRPNWGKDTFFLCDGQEYKLFTEDEQK